MSQKQGPISPIYNQKQGGCEYYKEGSAGAAQRGKIYYIGLLLSSLCSVFWWRRASCVCPRKSFIVQDVIVTCKLVNKMYVTLT